jgi:hypothetical protein
MRIAVIDGQGGGIGKSIIEKLRLSLGQSLDIIALGTNVLATSAMLKAGADEGASGENAILVNAPKVDLIIGSLGIIAANSMLGELSPAMARAIAESPAKKLLIPLNRCNLYVIGARNETLPQYIDDMVETVKSHMV